VEKGTSRKDVVQHGCVVNITNKKEKKLEIVFFVGSSIFISYCIQDDKNPLILGSDFRKH
jgi:hypothetical protein